MSRFRIVDADGARLERWDEHVERSVNGTLFHLRRFLGYHGDRFADSERLLLLLDGERLVAQLPAAISRGRLASPYGASYGSLVFQERPTYESCRAAIVALLEFATEAGVEEISLTPPHALCASTPLDTFAFALLEAGFQSAARDIVSAAILRGEGESRMSERARRAASKAERAGVTVELEAPVDDLWATVDATFAKHGTQPTHTREEFRMLADALPDRVGAAVAYLDGRPVAGLGEFALNERVQSAFYICQDPSRQTSQALSLLVAAALERARSRGFVAYDFGTSTVNGTSRPNVWEFKENFTRVGVFRETFRWHGNA